MTRGDNHLPVTFHSAGSTISSAHPQSTDSRRPSLGNSIDDKNRAGLIALFALPKESATMNTMAGIRLLIVCLM
ncbi:hypothetical protein An11g04140 [Aspergillus niger]|uniref:Uncharacterized protein n=2 Tax=Aspergillus niger TaxID=5061 RepID=A2QW76_ASPNC|nr:hypothetical protein An11g04140 [Aspergillus niger]CAK40646.1 hypothetical protein An11g04140 [Aspergillus niger]